MPYLYNAFIEASETGVPIMMPMLMEDPVLTDIDDQFLLGRSLLVAPVVEKGGGSRLVHFPKGEWFDWWSDRPTHGTIDAEAPLSRIPLFVRAGAVIPMWPEAPPSTMDYHPEVIDLHVFVPSKDGVFRSRLVEDDGATYGYESGERLTTRITLTREGSHVRLDSETTGNPYSGFRRKAFRIHLRGSVTADIIEIAAGVEGFTWSRG